ncbi:MAG: hypothetical protein ACON4W_06485, partial [Parvibaculales bacterium]
MEIPIYEIYKYLTEIPFNIWFWLMVLTPPGLLFSVGPERTLTSHVLRVLAAVALGYVFINLSLGASQHIEFQNYHECQRNSGYPGFDNPKAHRACEHHLSPSGPNNVMALGFGWAYAGVYVGIWEMVWRIRHYRKIREMGRAFQGRWFSTL